MKKFARANHLGAGARSKNSDGKNVIDPQPFLKRSNDSAQKNPKVLPNHSPSTRHVLLTNQFFLQINSNLHFYCDLRQSLCQARAHTQHRSEPKLPQRPTAAIEIRTETYLCDRNVSEYKCHCDGGDEEVETGISQKPLQSAWRQQPQKNKCKITNWTHMNTTERMERAEHKCDE